MGNKDQSVKKSRSFPMADQPPNCKNYSHNLAMLKACSLGDLIEIKRGVYSHWAIFAGGEDVIHLAGEDNDGLDADWEARHVFVVCGQRFDKARVVVESFWPVAHGDISFKNNSRDRKWPPFAGTEVVERALAKIGKVEYSLLFENCEHFAKWCRYGRSKSDQVDKFLTAVGAGAAVSLAAGVSVMAKYCTKKKGEKGGKAGGKTTLKNSSD